MRAALVAPNYSSENRGNGVTVRRIERSLRAAGCEVAVFEPERCEADALWQRVSAYRPDCIHAFHAIHGGRPAQDLSSRLGIPFVITMTGTDLYDEGGGGARGGLGEVLRAASGLVIFHGSLEQRLRLLAPDVKTPVSVIPQGVTVPECPPREAGDDFVFLLPAGIRPVKDVLFALPPLARLAARSPQVRFRLVGPILDREYGSKVLSDLARLSWGSYGGERQHGQMAHEYAAAHVVLNTSRAEGGMANCLLEAMAAGRPVLAADIEGNRSLITPGVNGLLYDGEDDFLENALRLLEDGGLRQRLGAAGRCFVTAHCAVDAEAARYISLYEEVVRRCRADKSGS